MKASDIHIVSSFHYDYMYLRGSKEYFTTSFEILDRALELLERDSSWKYTVEQVVLIEEYARTYPDKLPQLRRLAQEKRLVFAPGMYVMPDMNMIDGESLYRQIERGKAWLQENLGVEPVSCWIADCWGHHAQLPQILTQGRYKGYFFWRCMRRDVTLTDFLWKGKDGTPILTHWLVRGYEGLAFPKGNWDAYPEDEKRQLTEKMRQNLNTLSAGKRAYGDNGATMVCNGGDFQLPQESALSIVPALCTDEQEIVFSTPDDYQKTLDLKSLQTVDGEFNSSFQGCYSSNIRIKQLLYANKERLLGLESMAAVCGQEIGLKNAWDTVLKHQFHDTLCGTVCNNGLEEVISDLGHLKQRFSMADGNGLFNPSSHRVRQTFVADGKRYLAELGAMELRSLDKVSCLPALEECGEKSGTFETPFYRCAFNGQGVITSLKTAEGMELLKAGTEAKFGFPVLQMDGGDNWILYDAPIGGDSLDMAFNSNIPDPLYRAPSASNHADRRLKCPQIKTVSVKKSSEECVIVQEGQIVLWRLHVPFSLEVTMSKHTPLITFKLKLVPHGKHFRLRAAFPMAYSDGTVRHGIPFGVEERGRSEFAAEGFMDYSVAGGGLTLLNRGIPGNNTDDTGVMLLSLFRSVAMEYKCESESSFNDGVAHEFEYAVMPHSGMDLCGFMPEMESYLRPVQRVQADGSAVFPTACWQLPDTVRVSSFKRCGGVYRLRMFEWGGQASECVLQLPEGIGEWALSDGLWENPTAFKKVENGRLALSFKPFEIKNIVLRQ